MDNNKVLIKLIVPEIDASFDILIPINELVWRVKEVMIKSINSLLGLEMPLGAKYILINKSTAKIYSNNEILYETDIRNATELILITYS